MSTLLLQPDDLILVVADETTVIREISAQKLKLIYLGKIDLMRGQKVTPVQLSSDHELRARFDSWVFGPQFDLETYWVTEQLKGGVRPPLTFHDEAILMAIVSRNPGFVGYVSRAHRDNLKRFNLRELHVIED